MIQMQSQLSVADNSGAKRVQCIKVLGGSKRRYARVGDIIKVSIKEAIPRGRVKKGEVSFAVVVRTVKAITRADGSRIRFSSSSATLSIIRLDISAMPFLSSYILQFLLNHKLLSSPITYLDLHQT